MYARLTDMCHFIVLVFINYFQYLYKFAMHYTVTCITCRIVY